MELDNFKDSLEVLDGDISNVGLSAIDVAVNTFQHKVFTEIQDIESAYEEEWESLYVSDKTIYLPDGFEIEFDKRMRIKFEISNHYDPETSEVLAKIISIERSIPSYVYGRTDEGFINTQREELDKYYRELEEYALSNILTSEGYISRYAEWRHDNIEVYTESLRSHKETRKALSRVSVEPYLTVRLLEDELISGYLLNKYFDRYSIGFTKPLYKLKQDYIDKDYMVYIPKRSEADSYIFLMPGGRNYIESDNHANTILTGVKSGIFA